MSAPNHRLLVIAGMYPPSGGGGSLRMVGLLPHLAELGWTPTVIAPRGRAGWFADPGLLDRVAGLEVIRVGLEQRRGLESLRRRVKDPTRAVPTALRAALALARGARSRLAVPDEHLAWSALALAQAWRLSAARAFDVLLTASFPYSAHLVGLALRRLRPWAWVADFADPWAGHPGRADPNSASGRIDRTLERLVAQEAHALTVASPGMLESFTRAHPRAHVHLLRNTYDPAEFVLPRVVRNDRTFELVFVGTFDADMSPPTPLVSALERLRERDPSALARLRVRILGGADLRSSAMIRDRLGDDAARWFRFEGYQSNARAVRAMRDADALFLSVAPGRAWHLTAKVYEYLASGRPILAVVPPGDCRDLLQRCGGARLIAPHDHQSLATALAQALAGKGLPLDRPRDSTQVASFAAPHVAAELAETFTRLHAQVSARSSAPTRAPRTGRRSAGR